MAHPKPPVPADRDEKAVVATLARLDPCKLVDGGGERDAPHRCNVGGPTGISVTFQERGPQDAIAIGETRIVAGAKVDILGPADPGCSAGIPISFGYEVAVHGNGDKPGCAAELPIITQVVRHLADPGAARQPDVPSVNHDLCTVFSNALRANKTDGEVGHQVHDTDFCYGADKQTLTSYYDKPPTSGKVQKIGGKQVHADPGDCEYTWDQGVVGGQHHVLKLVDCRTGPAVAASVIEELQSAPPAGDVHPLTYKADEDDLPFPGACRDYFGVGDDCVPYTPTEAPHGADAVTKAADADPYVACAVSVDAFQAQYGKALRPIVTATPADGCRLVQLSHEFALTFAVSSTLHGQAGPSIAWHRSSWETSTSYPTTTLCLAVDDAGASTWCVAESSHVDDHKASKEKLIAALTAIATTYLT